MLKKKYISILFLIFILGLIFFWFKHKVHVVDNKSSIAFTDHFIINLQANNIDNAFSMYSPQYINKNDKDWIRLFDSLNSQFGIITSFSISESHIIPVGNMGCVLTQYRINRESLSTNERFIVCPVENKYFIVGHELQRLDTNQSIFIGLTARENAIF